MTNTSDATPPQVNMPFDRIEVSMAHGVPIISMIHKGHVMVALTPERHLAPGDVFTISAIGTMAVTYST